MTEAFATCPEDGSRRRERLIYLGAVVESAAGEHLARIERAADFDITLDGSEFYRAACRGDVTDDRNLNAGLTCDLHTAGIDFRKPIPAQVANQLVEWAKQLTAMAEAVSQVPAQQLVLVPRAHNIVNTTTGEVTEAGPFYQVAQTQMLVKCRTPCDHLRIVTSILSEWPDQQKLFDQIVGGDMEQAVATT